MTQTDMFRGLAAPVVAPGSPPGLVVVRWQWGQHRAALAPGWHATKPLPPARARLVRVGLLTRSDVGLVEVVPA